MALIATAASSVMADSTVICEQEEVRNLSLEMKHKEESWAQKEEGGPYQDLLSTVVLLLNLLAKVSLRQMKVLFLAPPHCPGGCSVHRGHRDGLSARVLGKVPWSD